MNAPALARRPETQAPATTPIGQLEHALLLRARAQAAAELGYRGDLTPGDAWELLEQHAIVLVDVRTAEERKFVGYVPGSVHVPWQLGTAMQTNPRFLRELEGKVSKDAVLALLCRSGARSVAAATAATRAGFKHAYNVSEGFEGELDADRHRGTRNGWRHLSLPWIQD
jgi:rhodanese-related sulfurtransferase